MGRKPQSMADAIREGIRFAAAKASGREPPQALRIGGEIRPDADMLLYLRRWRQDGPLPGLPAPKCRWFRGRLEVDDFEVAVGWRRRHRPRTGDCFLNAQRFCVANQSFRYFEGLYLVVGEPVAHGWVVTDDGKVLDFTHEAVLRKLTREKEKVHTRPPLYYGTEFPREDVEAHLAKRERNEPMVELFRIWKRQTFNPV